MKYTLVVSAKAFRVLDISWRYILPVEPQSYHSSGPETPLLQLGRSPEVACFHWSKIDAVNLCRKRCLVSFFEFDRFRMCNAGSEGAFFRRF
jgi:hypothetical protein